MRFALNCARKDLLRLWRDPIALLTWIGIPLFVAGIMTLVFHRGETRPQGRLLVADLDDTFVSRMLVTAYSGGELGEMLNVESVVLDDGKERIDGGDASALLIIPEGFSSAFFKNEPAELRLITNPAQTIMPGIIEEVTSILLEAGYYLHKLLGEDLRKYAGMSGAPSDASIAATSVKVNHLIQDGEKYLDPPVISLTSEVVTPEPARQFNMGQLMFPSVMYMAVMFLCFGIGSDVWKEKNGGTLRRVLATPGSVSGFLAGKLLALGLVFLVLAAAGLVMGRLAVGLEVQAPVTSVLWITVSGTAIYLLVILIQIHGSTERGATVLTNLLVMTLAMIGGCFFPFEMMPDFLARIGRLTPNGWALVTLKSIMGGQAEAAMVAAGFGAMALGVALLFPLAARRLRRGFAV